MPGKRPTATQRKEKKVDAALGHAEQLINTVRSQLLLGKVPKGPGGGRPCRDLDAAEAMLRDAQIEIGGKPCGGGRPCGLLDEAQATLLGVQAELGGKPCGGGRPC